MDSNSPQPNQNPNGIAGKPLEPQIQGETHAYDAVQAANALPEKPQAPDIHEDIAKLHNQKIIQPIRTYESDVAELLHKKDTSVLNIAVAEKKKSEKKEGTKENKQEVVDTSGVFAIHDTGLESNVLPQSVQKVRTEMREAPPIIKSQPVVKVPPKPQPVPPPQPISQPSFIPRPELQTAPTLDHPARLKPQADVRQPEPQPIPVPQAQPRPRPQPKPQPAPIQIPQSRPIAVVQEEKAHARLNVNPKALTFVAVAILVIAILGFGGYFGYEKLISTTHNQTSTSNPTQSTKPIISTGTSQNTTKTISLIPNETVTHALAVKGPHFTDTSGSLIEVDILDTVSHQILAAQDFVNRWPSTMPSFLNASLQSSYVFGYQTLSTPQPFVVFKSNSYDNSFAGMLAWEPTLKNDIAKFMLGSSSLAVSTRSLFEDIVVGGKNARVLRDINGIPVIFYALPDKNTIIITTNSTTLQAILTHLIVSQ